MGGFSGFVQGLQSTLGPKLEARKKAADEKQSQLAQFYMQNLSSADGAVRDEAEKFLSKYYGDKESKGVLGKVKDIFGQIHTKKGQQQQGQPGSNPVQPPQAPAQAPQMDPSGEAPAAQPQAAPGQAAPGQAPPGRMPANPVKPPAATGIGQSMGAMARSSRAAKEADDDRKNSYRLEAAEAKATGSMGLEDLRSQHRKELEEVTSKHKAELKQAEDEAKAKTAAGKFHPAYYKKPDGSTVLGREYADGKHTDSEGEAFDGKVEQVTKPASDPAVERAFKDGYKALGFNDKEADAEWGKAVQKKQSLVGAAKTTNKSTNITESGTSTSSTTSIKPNPVSAPPGGTPQVSSKFSPTSTPGQAPPAAAGSTPSPARAVTPPSADGKQAQNQPQVKNESEMDSEVNHYLSHYGESNPFLMGGRGDHARVHNQAVVKRAEKFMKDSGLKFEDLQVLSADRKALLPTLRQMTEYDSKVRSFEGTLDNNTEVVNDLAKNIKSDIPLLNRFVNAARTATGKPEAIQLAAQMHGVMGEWAKIVVGSTGAAGAPEGELQKLSEFGNPNMSKEQVKGLAAVMKRDAASRRKANDAELSRLRGEIRKTVPTRDSGSGAPPSPKNAVSAPGAPSKQNKIRVQIPGQDPGEIDSSRLEEFKKKHPEARVLQ